MSTITVPSHAWTSVRLGGLAGVAGPVLFTAGFLIQEAFRREEFDPIAEPVSALEAGPNGWVQQANFVIFAAMMLLFTVGLHRGVSANRLGWLGPALLGVSAVGLLLAAIFPLRENAAGVTYDPGAHFVAGFTFFLSTALALLALSQRFRADRRWRGLARYALVAGSLALAGFALLGRFAIPDGAPLHDVVGLLQRVTILLVTFPCFIVIGLRLLRMSR